MNPQVRSASLINYANLAREAGLDPLALLAGAGLAPEVLDNPDLRIGSLQVRALLEASARQSGWADFGLRLAETRQFWVLGPLYLAVREQPTLRSALLILIRHMRLHNDSLQLWLEEDRSAATLHIEVVGGGAARQTLELSVGMLVRFLRRALPEGWQPLNVSFSHDAPPAMQVVHRVLGPRVTYDAPFNAIVFRAADMERPMATATRLDAETRQYVRSLIAGLGTSTVDQVRQLALVLLPSGQCSLAAIAGHLGLQERTVHRRLAREGASYGGLLRQLRYELVQQHLEQGGRKQSELALMLGFSGAAVFSRWFRGQFGCTPGQWTIGAE